MRRWVLFLLIFLAGLGILWWVDRGNRREPRPPEPTGTPGAQTGEGPLTPVQLDKERQGLAGINGPILWNGFHKDSGKLQYRVTAENSTSLGDGLYLLDKLVVRFFEEGTDHVRLLVTADKARGRLSPPPALDFDRKYPVEMDDVVATLYDGSPFVPLILRVPHAKGVYADETFESDDRVDIAGTGLSVDGVGLSFDGKARELRLKRDAHASLTLADGTPAALSAVGGLVITSLEKIGEGSSRIVASEKAHLTFEGQKPVVVDADTVELDALVARKPTRRVTPTRVSAHGSVRLAPVDGVFFGDDADLKLGANGRPESATLRGSPRVELVLHGTDTHIVPGGVAPKAADLEVKMAGQGPLEVDLGGDAHFDFNGPATVMLPSLDTTLTAQKKLSGTRQGESEFARLDASGGVEAHWGESTLTSDALSIERTPTPDGQIAAHLTSPGPTHVTGPLDDGGTFDLTAKDGLEFVRLAKSFQVPVARDVDLSVSGPSSFHAKAREVRDFDGLTRSFIGLGDVVFDSPKGSGRGQRLVAHGKDSAELIGAPSAPVHCDIEGGWIEARSIAFDVDRLRAEGDAHAVVGLEGTRYDVKSRWISLLRTPAGTGQELTLEAGGEVDAHLDDDARKLDLTAASIEAHASSPGQKLEHLKSEGLVANGNVVFHSSGEQELSGEGDRLVIEADRSGKLYPAEGQRVHAQGQLPKENLTFDMTAGVVAFARESLSAENPVIEIKGVEVPIGKTRTAADVPIRAIAGSMSVDSNSILFTEGVYLGQIATKETSWSLDAEKLVLLGSHNPKPAKGEPHFTVSTVLAWGGFQAAFAEGIAARGSSLLVDRDRNRLTLRGDPAELDNEGQRLSSSWLELELDTGFLRTAKGAWIPLDERNGPYEITFDSMEPLYGIDSRIEVIRGFSYVDTKHDRHTSAAWALFWLDEARLEHMASQLMSKSDAGVLERPAPPARPPAAKNYYMQKFMDPGFNKWIKEAYFEGNIEVFEKGERVMRADAMYANLVVGDGWVREIQVSVENPIHADIKQLKLHADWIRYSADGSAKAEHAVVTSCEFDVPHYVITLGDLNMKRRPTAKARKAIAAGRSEGADETDGYEISSKHNSIRYGKGPQIPLGPVAFLTDEKFHVLPESLSFLGIPLLTVGSSGRYGVFIGLSFALPLEWLSKQVGNALGDSSQRTAKGEPAELHSSNPAIVKYLNKRGLLIGAMNRVKQEGVFKLTSELDAIYDTGSDHGLVRVPTSERETLRSWLHIEGRRLLGDREWIDVRVSKQSDPGVQAEFFEHDYLRWEERETYLHWRKARGLDYSRVTVETELDNFRTEVIDEPSLGYARGRAGVTRWFHHDLIYSSDTTFSHLRRVEGDPRFQEFPFPDGFGDQEVVRMDTTHRWEMPLPLDVLDARLVPFVEARATAWDRGATSPEAPARFALLAGAEASTTFSRLYSGGNLHTLTPSIGVHTDIDVEQSGPTPAQFDGVEDPLDGNFADFGLRSRWLKPGDPRHPETEGRWLDIEVRETYANHLSGGRDEGWQPLRVNAQWFSEAFNIPFGVTHDARYDLEDKNAAYSRTIFAVRPVPSVTIETGYHSARDLTGGALYSVWSLAARYDFSPKWHFQASESISSASGDQLGSGFLLRRIGHDFIVEIEYSFVAGEGGSSIGFKLIPLVGYHEPHFSQLSSWQKEGD